MNKAIKLLMAALVALPLQSTAAVKHVDVMHRKTVKRIGRITRADANTGVKATLRYEQIANMKTPRIGHQLFPSGNGIVAVGGHTTNFQLTKTAEIYENGQWRELSIASPHDGGFSVVLNDGRVMVGGGFSSGNGVGQSLATDIYNPATKTFTAGPDMVMDRAGCSAIAVDDKAFVSGNWYATDPVMDRYDGSSFTGVGNMDYRSNPYMMRNKDGNVFAFSTVGVQGEAIGFYTFEGHEGVYFIGDYTFAASGETQYRSLPFDTDEIPLPLSYDVRSESSHVNYGGSNWYFLLAKTSKGTQLFMVDMDDSDDPEYPVLYIFSSFEIPSVDDAGKAITWRGGVFVNSARNELYIIGASGSASNQTLHIISYNYDSFDWTMASASGFNHDMLAASWTMLDDGRLACTGGGINSNFDAQTSSYIFTPLVAGQGDDDTPEEPTGSGPKLVVWLKSGNKVTYELADAPVTTFSGSQLIIRTNKVTISYERKNVLRYTYEDVVTKGIELMPGERRVEINRDGDEIVFRGLQVGGTASIYAVNGTLIEQCEVTDSRPLTISLKNRPNGVYIVKAGTETIKVMKR